MLLALWLASACAILAIGPADGQPPGGKGGFVPESRPRYLRYVKDIAKNWLDWKKLGPIVEEYRELIAADVRTDTHKQFSTGEFTSDTYGKGDDTAADGRTLKGFCQQRRAHLLNLEEIKKLDQK